jgi:hypothetical protein
MAFLYNSGGCMRCKHWIIRGSYGFVKKKY